MSFTTNIMLHNLSSLILKYKKKFYSEITNWPSALKYVSLHNNGSNIRRKTFGFRKFVLVKVGFLVKKGYKKKKKRRFYILYNFIRTKTKDKINFKLRHEQFNFYNSEYLSFKFINIISSYIN